MSEQPVWEQLLRSKQMLDFADAQTRELDQLTCRLSKADATARSKNDVWRKYLAWLVFARQAAGCIDRAGKAANRPADFSRWWEGLTDDPTHMFFRAERHAALKEGADAIVARELTEGLVYWTFPHGPHAGDPLVPRCQQYNNWLYYGMWAPACELLFTWTLPERRSVPVAVI